MVGELRHSERHFGRASESGLGPGWVLFAEGRESRSRCRDPGIVYVRGDCCHIDPEWLLDTWAVLHSNPYAILHLWCDCGGTRVAPQPGDRTFRGGKSLQSNPKGRRLAHKASPALPRPAAGGATQTPKQPTTTREHRE